MDTYYDEERIGVVDGGVPTCKGARMLAGSGGKQRLARDFVNQVT